MIVYIPVDLPDDFGITRIVAAELTDNAATIELRAVGPIVPANEVASAEALAKQLRAVLAERDFIVKERDRLRISYDALFESVAGTFREPARG